LTDSRTVEAAIAPLNPAVVMHAGGYTDTEKAETEPDLARIVNVKARARSPSARASLAHRIIHLSSSYVFDGSRPGLSRGRSGRPVGRIRQDKATAEAAVAQRSRSRHRCVPRLVFSPFGRNSLTSFLKRAGQQDEVLVVADQLVNPTAASDLAEGILTIARNLTGERASRSITVSSI